MSPSERSSSGESDDECLPDLQKLKPYDLEPEILSLDGIQRLPCRRTQKVFVVVIPMKFIKHK